MIWPPFPTSHYSPRVQLEVSEREMGVVALHIPIESLKTRSGLELEGGGAELFMCPYPLKVQARPPRE